jgi:hypothetical protein
MHNSSLGKFSYSSLCQKRNLKKDSFTVYRRDKRISSRRILQPWKQNGSLRNTFSCIIPPLEYIPLADYARKGI